MKLAYAVHGAGPPIVRVATWMTHLEFDWESPVRRHWLDALGDGHTLVRYDERGCGLSDRDVPFSEAQPRFDRELAELAASRTG